MRIGGTVRIGTANGAPSSPGDAASGFTRAGAARYMDLLPDSARKISHLANIARIIRLAIAAG